MAQRELPQFFPAPGWVEHDPLDIWQTQISVAHEAIANAGASDTDIAAIGITNQRETVIVWDKKTGQPIHNAIVWQDRRTSADCDRLRASGHESAIKTKTGLVIDPYFSATKLTWLLDNVEGARQRAERGELLFGTVDSWLIFNLTGGAVHATDTTNASRTMLFDIHRGEWDDDLLSLFRVPRRMLPQVHNSSHAFGQTAPGIFSRQIPISGVAGDQQAALFGQECVHPGMAKNTYGTGCFLLQNTGQLAVTSKNNLLTTSACQGQFGLEGSVFVGGAVIQWLRDGLGVIRTSSEVEALAASVADNGGVYVVPAFVGLGAPHWDTSARGSVHGLTRGSTLGHLARASLESIAFQTADVLTAMRADSGQNLGELRVDGGACTNNLLMQFQADILGVPVVRPKITETTALGAAYLAGLGSGFWSNMEEIASHWKVDQRFEPTMSDDQRQSLTAKWHKAVNRSKDWED